MLRSGISVLIGVFLLTLLIAGCAQDGSPMMPSYGEQGISGSQNSHSGNSKISRALWGVWHISIDPDTLTAEVTPVRGAMFTCNVTMFMQPPISPVHMVSLAIDPSSDPSSGYFAVDVTLRHPFPGIDFYNGFDVRGVLIADGSVSGKYDPSVIMAGIEDTRLENPDGYTRFWNWVEFTNYETILGATQGKLAPPNHPASTVNPYKYFADVLGPEDPVDSMDSADRGFFSTSGVNSRRYEIQFKMSDDHPVFDFNYAVDASWAEPDGSYAPDYPAEAFPISANCAEAYNLSVLDAGSDAYFVDDETTGGQFVFDLEVFDHQAACTTSGVPGEVSAIWLEGETLPSPVNALDYAVILPGNGYDSSVYQVTLSSLDLTHSGETEFLCTIENADPNTYEPQITGGGLFAYPDAPLAAYFKFTANIDDEGPYQPPTPPTTPVCIDPDVAAYGTQFAIASDGLIHSVYFDYDRTNAYWSYSDDLGNTWNKGNDGNPIYSVDSGNNPPYILIADAISMDANDQYVYVVMSEYDGPEGTIYCKVTAGRLDINDLSAGWEIVTVWSAPAIGDGRDNFGSPALSVRNDGGILITALYYEHFGGGFNPSYSFADSWAGFENITRQTISVTNGLLTYIYPRSTTCMVNDGTDFFYAIGGLVRDDVSGYGYGKMNSIVKFDTALSNWSFVQTEPVPNQSNSYQHFFCRGLAIDAESNIHWVFGYAYNNYGDNNYGNNYGDWHLSYGTGAASGDHDFNYTVPITEEFHHRSLPAPGYTNACNDYMFTHSSVDLDDDGVVYICYQSALNERIIYGIKNDGTGWSDPWEIEGEDFHGLYPFARMHNQSGYLMVSFTDLDYPSGGTGNPYFVAWK